MTLTLALDPDLAAQMPDIAAAAFAADLSGADPALLAGWLDEASAAVRASGVDVEAIASVEPFASWRRAYKQAGFSPSKVRASVEALARRVLKGGSVETGLWPVDAYNAASLATLAPLGAYDRALLPGAEIALRFARPASDRFSPHGGDSADYPLRDGQVVYGCGDVVLCYGFNHRDSRETAVSAATRHALFCGEAVNADQRGRLMAALEALSRRLAEAGAACAPLASVDAATPRAPVPE